MSPPEGIPPELLKRKQTSLGRQMAAIRRLRGYSQAGLATEADVGLLAVKAWETGLSTVLSLQKLLGVLGCHLVVTKTEIKIVDGTVPKDWRAE